MNEFLARHDIALSWLLVAGLVYVAWPVFYPAWLFACILWSIL